MELKTLIGHNAYIGRGVFMGQTPDASCAVMGYFIMGRSANSRNRVFAMTPEGLYTRPYDETKVEEPSLIIYRAAARHVGEWIVTNGDQTETVLEGLKRDMTLSESLRERIFEPDAPHFTPRISGLMHADGSYELNILKNLDGKGSACGRFTFSYPGIPGTGHLIHTYEHDGPVLPPFEGEPRAFSLDNGIDEVARNVWDCLNEDNRISLFVCFQDIETQETQTRIINKLEGEEHARV